MKRDPHFHDSVFRVAWVATFQQVCDDALVLLGDVTLDVGDSRLNVLQFSSRDHCPAPPITRGHTTCSRDEDVRYNTTRLAPEYAASHEHHRFAYPRVGCVRPASH